MSFIDTLVEKLAPSLEFAKDATRLSQKFGVNLSDREIKKMILQSALGYELAELENRFERVVTREKDLQANADKLKNHVAEKEKELKAKYEDSIAGIKRVIETENDEKIRNAYKAELALALEKDKTAFLQQELKAARENNLAIIGAFKGQSAISEVKINPNMNCG
jgi:hypothetical protein